MNLGIGRVQNVTAYNVFLRDRSLSEFVLDLAGMTYADIPPYCDAYYGKNGDGKYFGQIVTPINLLGLIQTDDEEIVQENPLIRAVYESQQENLAEDYLNYFLCMWQFPIPSTKPGSGRDMEIFKPYCLLLKILLELYEIDEEEAYLSAHDFNHLFLETEEEMPSLEEINRAYAQTLIHTRENRRARNILNQNGSLIYIVNTLAESDLLTKDAADYPAAEDFYIGLKTEGCFREKADFIIRAYGSRYFDFDRQQPSGNRTIISEYGAYLNDIRKFQVWRSCYMNIERIKEFLEYCESQGFYYTDDLIRRFVMSLETKPFLLLTGISGSGKTKIAELWIKYLKEKDLAEGLQIAVGSNWTDNKKLLGFQNVLLDEEDRYQSTALVELLRRANCPENRGREYIVILDEMNLSRVEMYFADFLSALEALDHKITLPNGEELFWEDNIKIIGTVNVDESTYMFSPKVLDRANVIEMNGMNPREYIGAVKDKEGKVYGELERFGWYQDYLQLLEHIYEALNGEFAYRVIDEISRYLYLNILTFGDGEDLFKKCMDEQIDQKILPKLHGSKVQLKPKLDKLQGLFAGQESYVLVNAKLEQMQEDIKKGYASFIGEV